MQVLLRVCVLMIKCEWELHYSFEYENSGFVYRTQVLLFNTYVGECQGFSVLKYHKCSSLSFAGVLSSSQTSSCMVAASDSLRFSSHTWDKATKAKVTLENYYSNLISQHLERKQRCFRILHTIRKVKFLYKNSILTKLYNFLVKSKLSTAKKSKTAAFSRVFTQNNSTIFLGKSKLNFWTLSVSESTESK